jgi:hypothetical protein
MTLGNAAAAQVRLLIWCDECQHRADIDLSELVAKLGPRLPGSRHPETLAMQRTSGPRREFCGERHDTIVRSSSMRIVRQPIVAMHRNTAVNLLRPILFDRFLSDSATSIARSRTARSR